PLEELALKRHVPPAAFGAALTLLLPVLLAASVRFGSTDTVTDLATSISGALAALGIRKPLSAADLQAIVELRLWRALPAAGDGVGGARADDACGPVRRLGARPDAGRARGRGGARRPHDARALDRARRGLARGRGRGRRRGRDRVRRPRRAARRARDQRAEPQ